MGADTKGILWGGGALERGHGAAFEPLAQLGDALGSVCTENSAQSASVFAAEHVIR